MRTRSVFGVLLLAALVVPVGCGEGEPASGDAITTAAPEGGGSWATFRGDPGLTGVATAGLPDQLELLWTYEVGKAITSSAVVGDGRVYFGADDYKLHCVDAESGEGIWTYPTEDMIEAPPLLVDGGVYVGSSDFFCYALDAESGELRWKFETDDRIVGGANYNRGEDGLWIVIGSYDSNLYCFDATSGEERWRYSTDNYVNGTPAVAEGRAVFGGCDAVLHAVDLATGEAEGTVELGPDCHVAGSVGISGGCAYLGHYGNLFIRVELDTGDTLWSYGEGDSPFFSSPAIGEERVVFGGRDRNLHCARRSDGEPLWKFATRRKVDGSPVIAGDDVIFGSADGRLYRLDLLTGEERWSHDLGRAIVASPAVTGGRVYIGSTDGLLYAFGSKN